MKIQLPNSLIAYPNIIPGGSCLVKGVAMILLAKMWNKIVECIGKAMIKIIICILVLSLNVSSASKSDIVKIVPDVPVQTTLLELFKEYGYDKPISQETKKNLKSNLLHHLRKIVQNEKIYHSYALFILSQLNEGRSDHIINQLFFSQDWKKIYDALKAVYFFGYPDDLTPLIINQIKKNL